MAGQAWICQQCRSINDARDSRCYSCGTSRQAGQGGRGVPWRAALLLILTGIVVAAGGRFVADSGLLQRLAQGQPSLFEAQLDRLPADQQSAMRERIQALANSLGDVIPGASDERLQRFMVGGMSRLDDERLVRRVELMVTALGKVDTEFCAALVRAGLGGTAPQPLHTAALMAVFLPDELAEWLDIGLSAAEAEVAAHPPRRTVSEREAERLLEGLVLRMRSTDVAVLGAVAEGKPVSSSELCRAIVSMYRLTFDLPRNQRVKFALVESSP